MVEELQLLKQLSSTLRKMSDTLQNCLEHQPLVSDAYPDKLLEGLFNLRTRNILCDIMLEAEGITFPVHKVILASVSSYCKLLFGAKTAAPGNQQNIVIKLNNVSARGLKHVLDFVYSNRLNLTLDTIEEILKAAEILLVRDAIKLCFKFLEECLSQRNCMDIVKITQKSGPQDLKQKAASYVGQYYKHILGNHRSLVELDKVALCTILDDNGIQGYSELELFDCTIRWLYHDENRLKDAAEILKRIRFCLIPAAKLQKCVQETSLMKTNLQCHRYLQEALSYHSHLYAQPLIQSARSQIRSITDHLVILGGRTKDNRICSDVWVADETGSCWRKMGEMCIPLYHHKVVVVNDFVFVIGGQHRFEANGKQPSNEVFRFDVRNNSWLQVAGMLERRTRFHADTVLDHIISVAGGTIQGNLTNTVEEYKPVENKWQFAAPFPVAVADHAGAVHKAILYISGVTLKDIYSYLPRLQRWIVNRAMTFARCDHGMATIGDKIFCVGGRALNSSSEWVHVNETEYYVPGTDQWTTLKVSPFNCCQFSTSVHNSKLYITGGGSLHQMMKKDSVFIYHPEARRWERVGALPLPLMDHAACTLKLCDEVLNKLKREERVHPLLGSKKSSTLKLLVTD
ncbi:kelch-like protein 9 isoform X3 [Callorhinchus milii]|uniref:kelch-like protein 9 isoform X3 n=1 Tax=Callorhinchus milii TaxID=7868 RepID=UPI0004574DCA|nr:kelch-like protein 9 isoform X3 [Callorhinchus milii]|eukprot:gi/632957335/ref/XP_007894421.1/ PREDICTED: kelch-like protein 9 isoform X2 [Callorhinchus milii]